MGSDQAGSGCGPGAAPQHRKGHRRQESMYAMTGLYAESGVCSSECVEVEVTQNPTTCTVTSYTKSHSRNPSAGFVDREREKREPTYPPTMGAEEGGRECGILGCRPGLVQSYATIRTFVLLLSFLVTLQQALSSGYINSVITTIEKRFEIPSSLSGLIASCYEIGNVITVIFVSYLGSRRHIPVWIAVGALVMGVGSLVFMVPHFMGEPYAGASSGNASLDNICRGVSVREQDTVLSRLSSPPLAPHNNLRGDNCIQSTPSTFGPVLVFIVAQVLLGCGGSPLFTLGTTYIDDHVRPDSASMYIGFMYSMAAFGPVLGFLLGAYLLSFHMDALSDVSSLHVGGHLIGPDNHRWVGMWWGGFLLCGLLLLLVAIPFFSFPKELLREKEKVRLGEKAAAAANCATAPNKSGQPADSAYGRDIKDIPVSMWRLVCNPVYVVTCLGACMELVIVSGFVVFLPKYLETQFSLGKSQASVFTGSIAIPGACIGIFMGGCLLKRLELRPKGAVQFVIICNTVCLACYALLFFLGCDNVKMAGTTTPYYNSSSRSEPFQVNLTAACNFGCSCSTQDVEPVCGNNGLTYFSPCHAGCTAFSSRSNYTNCACVHGSTATLGPPGGVVLSGAGGSSAAASVALREDYAEVTVVPVATAGPCSPPCTTIFPFLILLFFMTFIVAVTQMPLLMIVLRSVSEEERSFALGMQFVIVRLFGYIPAPILFGNLIDSTCLLWKSSCGERGGRCLLYDIEQFRFRYVGLCGGIKILALGIFLTDWWLVRRRKSLEGCSPLDPARDIAGSIISLDKLFEEKGGEGAGVGVMSGSSSHSYVNTCLTVEPLTLSMSHQQRVLVASKHLRNDSKTIQLEARSGEEEEAHHKPHSRTNSRDCGFIFSRSASKELASHSRHHSRTNSRDISFEQIKQLALKSVENLDLASVGKCGDEEAKKLLETTTTTMVLRHRRNNSKDMKSASAGGGLLKGHKRSVSHHTMLEGSALSAAPGQDVVVPRLDPAPAPT